MGRTAEEAAVGLVQALGAVAGADRHRTDRPNHPRLGGAWCRHRACPRGGAPPERLRTTSGEQRVPPPPLGREARLGERHRYDQAYDADCVRIVHKHRNLLAHAPERLHEDLSADCTDMIHAATAKEVEARRRAFLRKWRLKCRAVADSLEEAGEALFAFPRLPSSQWKSARTSATTGSTPDGGACRMGLPRRPRCSAVYRRRPPAEG